MKKIIFLLILLLSVSVSSASASEILFEDEVKIITFGDSITFGEGAENKSYPQRLQEILRNTYKNERITVINKGYRGMSTIGAMDIYEEILNENPGILVLMFGINDASGYVGTVTPLKIYKNNLTKIITKAKNQGTEVILLTPTPTSTPHYTNDGNQRIYKYSREVVNLGSELNVTVVDMYSEISNLYAKKLYSNYELQGFDWVHFTQKGYDVIADTVADKGFGLNDLLYQVNKKGDFSLPIVSSPFIQTDFTTINVSLSQFFYRNYFATRDTTLGSYLNFPFFNKEEGTDLYLIAPKTEGGGLLSVYDNGIYLNRVNFFGKDITFDNKILIAKDLSYGYHNIQFETSNLEKGQSIIDNSYLYFTEFQFSVE